MNKTHAITAGIAGILLSSSALAGATDTVEISALPDEGPITLMGTVADIDDSTEFTLRDRNGDTIDVELSEAQTLEVGDSVVIGGIVDDEFLGMGQEINDATVTLVSRMETTGNYHTEKNANYKGYMQSVAKDNIQSNVDMGVVTRSGTALRSAVQSGNDAVASQVNLEHANNIGPKTHGYDHKSYN